MNEKNTGIGRDECTLAESAVFGRGTKVRKIGKQVRMKGITHCVYYEGTVRD